MPRILPPMIYMVFVWRDGQGLPAYFADSMPDLCSIKADTRITQVRARRAWLTYD